MTNKSFKSEFLDNYLSVGVGGLSKKDTEILVMFLLDKYGVESGPPLRSYPNQEVSALLKTPVNKIKQLRYEAGLKYWGSVEDHAKARLLVALSRAAFEIEADKIRLIIEDSLTKNWLQGQLKNNNQYFDNTFNTEVILLKSSSLFIVLEQFFDNALISEFKEEFEKAKSEKNLEKLRKNLNDIAKKFAEEISKVAGTAVASHYVALLLNVN